jgi:predicted nucleic acid-binding protein
VTLVDTSVWIEHLRRGDPKLMTRLEDRKVLGHPFVIGELALSNMRQRQVVLDALGDLPQAIVARDTEVLHFINLEKLHGQGIGYVDAHLLASAMLSHGAALWTRDLKLHTIAVRLGVAAT